MRQLEWVLLRSDAPDLVYAVDLMHDRHSDWDPWGPAIELVQCGQVVKPAVFLKVGHCEYNAWSERVLLDVVR
ncbi:hypothetical protein PV963_36765 [Streptomyces coeruleorubidus]|uniref:hypothetical protein n=1 Tax=Streptomyces coeruleorubidus TaxID=116188 RepID=UPI00237F2B36|nr:hypothetical protein [Streptomyces coeruleorubidus]WDV55514.1 hypothetical protein PV963_36765 [Streptomyces coeruleorubidus]